MSFTFTARHSIDVTDVVGSGEVAGGAGGAVAPPAGLKKGAPK